MSQLMPDLFIARAEAARRGEVARRLVRPLCVVVAHPLIQRLLCRLQVVEYLPGVELDAQGAVEALDLARRGRRAWLGPGECGRPVLQNRLPRTETANDASSAGSRSSHRPPHSPSDR